MAADRQRIRELVEDEYEPPWRAKALARASSPLSTLALAATGLAGISGLSSAAPSGSFGAPGQPLVSIYTEALKDTADAQLVDLPSGGAVGLDVLSNLPTFASDPSGTTPGDMWYRSDSEQVRVQTENNGIVGVRLGEAADLDANTHDIIKVQTASGTRTLPVADPVDATNDFVRFYTETHGVVGLHELLAAFEVTATLNGGTATAIVYEDTNQDGTADNTQTVTLSGGNNTYDLGNLQLGTGNDYWVTIIFEPASVTDGMQVDLLDIDNGGASWDVDADWNAERDNTGVVHDADNDHPGAGSIAPGYLYGGIDDVYPALQGADLVGWWPLHEHSGQANDLSGQGNHGTVTGATQGVGGRGGLTAYSFDGADDDVALPTSIVSSTDDFSVSMWFKADSVGTANQRLINLRNGPNFLISIGRSGNSELGIFADGTDYTVKTISADTWIHVVVTYDHSTTSFEVYVDTVNEASINSNSGSASAGNRIGEADDGTEGFGGIIGEVRIYNTVLTASQAQTLYDWGSGDYAVPPDNNDGGVSYYDFNSANANDQWGTNDGTVSGATHVADGGPRGDGAYSFDGTDDRIDVSPFSISYPFSMSAWFKNPAVDEVLVAVADKDVADQQHRMLTEADGTLGASSHDGTQVDAKSSTVVTGGAWYHGVAIFHASDSREVFVNGVSEDTNTSSVTISGLDRLSIGVSADSSPFGFCSADIDDVRIYDRALDPWEVQELYQYGTLGRDMRELTVNAV